MNDKINHQGRILILGLGPGDPASLTCKAWQIIKEADEIYVRTGTHPTLVGIPEHVQIHAFDYLYEAENDFQKVYRNIVDKIIQMGRRGEQVIYAVPGHPLVAEATTPAIIKRARWEGIPVEIIDGLSFLEPALSALEIDVLPHMSIVDAFELAEGHFPQFPPNTPAIIAQIYSKAIASHVKLTLMAIYPDSHPVKYVHSAGTDQMLVEDILLYQIDRSENIGNLSLLYLPPLGEATSLESFQEIVAHLRAPNGCPWDREQTHQSLRPNLLEETYEVLAAIDADDPIAMQEELGDLLLHIVLHAQIASEYGEFTLSDVIRGIHQKIVRRHPQVFGDLELNDIGEVIKNWEKLKAKERKENGHPEKGLLDGISVALPALVQAEVYQERAARVGFDWKDISGVIDKINEEVEEIRTAETDDEKAQEIGDLIFAIVNLTRWYKIDAESALREANLRFKKRFSFIENYARKHGKQVADLTFDEMEALWQQAKECV